MSAPPPEALNPLYQIGILVGTVIGVATSIVLGVRKSRQDPPTAGPDVRWFFDGPIGKALGCLEGIYRELKELRDDEQRFANERNQKLDRQVELLRDLIDRPPRRH